MLLLYLNFRPDPLTITRPVITTNLLWHSLLPPPIYWRISPSRFWPHCQTSVCKESKMWGLFLLDWSHKTHQELLCIPSIAWPHQNLISPNSSLYGRIYRRRVYCVWPLHVNVVTLTNGHIEFLGDFFHCPMVNNFIQGVPFFDRLIVVILFNVLS